MTQHTPEPWQMRQDQIRFLDYWLKGIPNAARIVAAVNACSDIPIDQLQPGSVKALVEALKQLVAGLNDAGDTRPLIHGYEVREARAALAPFRRESKS